MKKLIGIALVVAIALWALRRFGRQPNALTRHLEEMKFSPPAWGWSEHDKNRSHDRYVLPTRVGMVRCLSLRRAETTRSPHPRGDGPGP